MPISIHGKQYITVAERVQEAGDKFLGLNTEVLYQSPVVVKATVTTSKGVFTGISAANPSKSIEKMSPYEVAETSAVGRALGFAGYGVVDGIATADEIAKTTDSEDMSKLASMYQVNSTLELMEKLQKINDDESRTEAIATVIEGLKLCKEGKKPMETVVVTKIHAGAVKRIADIQGEVI